MANRMVVAYCDDESGVLENVLDTVDSIDRQTARLREICMAVCDTLSGLSNSVWAVKSDLEALMEFDDDDEGECECGCRESQRPRRN